MKLDFEQMQRALETERDPDREAWLRGERASDKGLTVLWTGFGQETPTEHAQRMVANAVAAANQRGANAPKIPSVNRAHYPSNCAYSGCETMLWGIPGQMAAFCDEHNTEEIRKECGF